MIQAAAGEGTLLYPNLCVCLQLCWLQYLHDTDGSLESQPLQQQEATSHRLALEVHTGTEVPTGRGTAAHCHCSLSAASSPV